MKRRLVWELEFNMIGTETESAKSEHGEICAALLHSFYLVHQSDFADYLKYPFFSLRNRKLFNIRSLQNTNPSILEAEVLHTVIYKGRFVYVLPDEIEF